MKMSELARRLAGPLKEYPERDQLLARSAFIMNLVGVLKITLPDDIFPEGTPRDSYFFHFGVLCGHFTPDEDVDQVVLKEAHCALTMPWSRAIISRVLYQEDGKPVEVTTLGVPKSYEV